MPHIQNPLTVLRKLLGFPYIGEEDAAQHQAVPSLLYVKKADGTFEPVGAENPVAVSLTNRTVTGAAETLTVDNTVGGKALASIPADATGAMITLDGGDIRALWTGGAPTATDGHLVMFGDTIMLMTRADLLAFRAIRTTATNGTLTITYYR